jgi:hypothetical protein
MTESAKFDVKSEHEGFLKTTHSVLLDEPWQIYSPTLMVAAKERKSVAYHFAACPEPPVGDYVSWTVEWVRAFSSHKGLSPVGICCSIGPTKNIFQSNDLLSGFHISSECSKDEVILVVTINQSQATAAVISREWATTKIHPVIVDIPFLCSLFFASPQENK